MFKNMSSCRLDTKLRRSKSTGALDSYNTNYVDSINWKSVTNSCESASSTQDKLMASSEKLQEYGISTLKRQLQKLQNMMQQQQNELGTMKDYFKICYCVRNNIVDLFEHSVKTLEEIDIIYRDIESLAPCTPNSQAKSLLDAIECKQKRSVDCKMQDAVLKLPNVLEDNNVKERSPSNEAGNLLSDVNGCLPEKLPRPYKPILKLTSWVHNLFTKTHPSTSKNVAEFEEGSELLLKAIRNTSLIMDGVDEKNHSIELNNNVKFQYNKLKKSSENLPKLMMLQTNVNDEYYNENLPSSPPQPADPEVSIIDHLMQSAIINKRIEEGQFNKAFEEALSSCNLALVMGACRAADPAVVFDACRLSQSVLLSLVQQLATDMVHETQLKCRYLEEALINLDVTNQVTRAHLPVVVDEVRKHLSKFVRSYPYHVASRRIALIILAADNLMK